MSTVDTLLIAIFGSNEPALYPEFAAWMRGSRRFGAFATTYQDKIRNKLKNARDVGSMKDLRAELETALLLLQEKRFTLDYERYDAAKQRGPDFTVTFRMHTPFNVEVRHIHSIHSRESDDNDINTNNYTDWHTNKLIAVLCDKVGQMPPGIINVLWLVTERAMTDADLNNAAITLRQLAERKTEDFFTLRGFTSAAAFLKQYRHLSGVVLHQSGLQSDFPLDPQPAAHYLWLNPLSRHPLLPEIATAIQRLNS